MSEPNVPPPTTDTGLLVVKFLIVTLILYPIAHYILFTSTTNNTHIDNLNGTKEIIDNNDSTTIINDTIMDNNENKMIKKKIRRPPPPPPPQPTCNLSYLKVILLKLCTDLYLENSQCTKDDFKNLEKHKIPIKLLKNSKEANEPRATIVGFFAAGLLISSLSAALFEFYKAKSASTTTPTKTKTPLTRKCSLADLTVLKHNRKELVRKESFMEIPENGTLKQLAFRPPPLHRRCSFPVGPIEYSPTDFTGYLPISRRSSMVDCSRNILMGNRRVSLLESTSRRTSVIDTRYNCLNSNDGSPERRHWTHLVHRH